MGRKVFVSLLGTGFYSESVYVRSKSGFRSSETRFIQQATMELLGCRHWSGKDAALFLLTDKAREENWNKSIQVRLNRKTGENEPYHGLEAVIEGMGLPFRPKALSIPDGKDEREMWDIFNIMFNAIEDGDELYFDLTHGFRYLPMLILVLGSYAKFLKEVSIASITYGNFEAKVGSDAPIVDLLPLSALQDWTFAAGEYMKNGSVSKLVDLSEKEIKPILANSDTREACVISLKQFVGNLGRVIDERLYCRGLSIQESRSLCKAKDSADKLETTVIAPLNPIFGKIKDSFGGFVTSGSDYNMLLASEWCCKYGHYQQALTLLEEYVITFVCKRHGRDILDKEARESVPFAFEVLSGSTTKDRYRGTLTVLLDQMLEDDFLKFSFRTFKSMKDSRNDINHAGIRDNASKSSKIKEIISASVQFFKDAVNRTWPEVKMVDSLVTEDNPAVVHRIFVNLSNHPHCNWTAKQIEAAQEFGEIVDIPFPAVNSSSTSEEVQRLADEYVTKVIDMQEDAVVTAHIMGEMTLSFSIISKLKGKGIRCVASTTERVVRELGDGKMETRFNFQQFRNY